MTTKYLLPHSFKIPGRIILIIDIIFGFIFICFDEEFDIKLMMPALHNSGPPWGKDFGWLKIISNSIIDEVTTSFIIIGALFIALSKEKVEDEYIMKIRLESIVWAVIVNSIIMLFCIFAFYGFSFLIALMFNLVSVLMLFVVKFKFELRRGKL